MNRQRFGEVLSRLVPLSDHDISEILNEQKHTHRPFGELAITMGKCSPQDVWAAWSNQQPKELQQVDLDTLGVDSSATQSLPRGIATALGVLPIRQTENALIVATYAEAYEEAVKSLASLVSTPVKFVLAEESQVRKYMAIYYPPSRNAG